MLNLIVTSDAGVASTSKGTSTKACLTKTLVGLTKKTVKAAIQHHDGGETLSLVATAGEKKATPVLRVRTMHE